MAPSAVAVSERNTREAAERRALRAAPQHLWPSHGGEKGMIEGWMLAGIILVIGVLVLVGVCNNAVRSCDEKRRYRESDRTESLSER
jgi:hypothetical protein